MTARCLRCGAGNEWIEGAATLKAEPDSEAVRLLREAYNELVRVYPVLTKSAPAERARKAGSARTRQAPLHHPKSATRRK